MPYSARPRWRDSDNAARGAVLPESILTFVSVDQFLPEML
jgi:hypothetical protein